MSRTQSFPWYKMFTEGGIDVEDERRSRRPTTSRTDKDKGRVREFILLG